MSAVILTNRGMYFNILEPEFHNFDIEEIAHSLSMLCRFTGHVDKFYSVAQHSVYVSQCVPPEDAMAGLLHDATEAYLGDVASPLKRLLPEYKRIEERVWLAIASKFKLPGVLPKSVHIADAGMLLAERKALLAPVRHALEVTWPSAPEMPVKVEPWEPLTAKLMFLQRYWELTHERRS